MSDLKALKVNSTEYNLKDATARTRTLTNLLRPTLATTTVNGVTCTANVNDGTYTLNGTATADTKFYLIAEHYVFNGTYRLTGCPAGGSSSTYLISVQGVGASNDSGNGATFTLSNTSQYIIITVYSGYTCSNLVFKPMLTTDLDATYDDFVPYTGDTGSLNGDVADIREDVDVRIAELKMLGWTVPDDCPIQNTVNGNTFTQKVGRVDLGSLTWSYYSDASGAIFYVSSSNMPSNMPKSKAFKLFCSQYDTASSGYVTSSYAEKTLVAWDYTHSQSLVMKNSSYTSATSFKSAMSGVYLYYELASSVTWQMDGNELTNLKTVGDAWNSSSTYTVGQYCIYGNALWKCLTQNSGVTPTEGSYWTKTDVASELSTTKYHSYGSIVTIASGTSYTAPCDGIMVIQINVNSIGTFWNTEKNSGFTVSGGAYTNTCTIPVFKDEVVSLTMAEGTGSMAFWPLSNNRY